VTADAAQWEQAAAALSESRHRLWRDHSDAVNLRLVDRWLGVGAGQRVLKTDLFDEAVGRGLCADLGARFPRLFGIDVSSEIVRRARRGGRWRGRSPTSGGSPSTTACSTS
jgi:hypothetical protein